MPKQTLKLGILLFSLLSGFFYPHSLFSQDYSSYPSLNVDYSPWTAFAPKIQGCSLGQFTLPNPIKIALLKLRLESVKTQGPNVQASIQREIAQARSTYEIYGWQNDLCHVVIKDFQYDPNADTSLGFIGFDCNFTAEDLNTLSGLASALGSGTLQITANDDPTAAIKGKACKALVHSLPPPPDTHVVPPVYFIQQYH